MVRKAPAECRPISAAPCWSIAASCFRDQVRRGLRTTRAPTLEAFVALAGNRVGTTNHFADQLLGVLPGLLKADLTNPPQLDEGGLLATLHPFPKVERLGPDTGPNAKVACAIEAIAGFRVASTNYLAACTKEGKNAGVFLERRPSMWAFIVAIIAFGLTQVISLLVAFRYGLSDNQSLPRSTAAQKTSTIGALIAIAIAASHWLPESLLAWAPEFDAAHFLPFLVLSLAALFAALLALLQYLERL